jgi:hypothetical protein
MPSLDDIFGDVINNNADQSSNNDQSLDNIFGDVISKKEEQPQEQPKGYLGSFWKGTKGGFAGTVGGVADFVDANIGVGKSIGDWGNDVSNSNAPDKQYSLSDRIPFMSDYWTNSSGAAYDAGQAVGSSAALLPLTVVVGAALPEEAVGAAAAGSAGLLGKAGLSKLSQMAGSEAGKSLIKWGTAGAIGKLPEAASEGGNVYRDMIGAGYSPEEARAAANKDALENVPLLMSEGALEMTGLTGKLGKAIGIGQAGDGFATRFGKNALLNVPIQTASEGATELEQQILSDTNENKPHGSFFSPSSWTPDEESSMGAGLVGGGLFGTVGAGTGALKNNSRNIMQSPIAKDQTSEDLLATFPSNTEQNNISNVQEPDSNISGSTASTNSNSNFETFVRAISGQESGDNYDAENGRTGAAGKYQIMPENWPSWSEEAGLEPGAPMTPENQETVARYKLRQLYDKYGAKGAAEAWYGGEGAVDYSEEAKSRPQGNGDEPSINEYSSSVLSRMKAQGGDPAAKSSGNTENSTVDYTDIDNLIKNGLNDDQLNNVKDWAKQEAETTTDINKMNFLNDSLDKGNIYGIIEKYPVELSELLKGQKSSLGEENKQSSTNMSLEDKNIVTANSGQSQQSNSNALLSHSSIAARNGDYTQAARLASQAGNNILAKAYNQMAERYNGLKNASLPVELENNALPEAAASIPITQNSVIGNTDVVRTDDGTEFPIQYKVVPADSLIVSHNGDFSANENYPQELQPRDRDRVSMKQQINNMVNSLRPADLGEGRSINQGAPLVNADNVVENGNGRTMALKSMYDNQHENGQVYKQYLLDNAGKFGINPNEISKIQNPVLVRQRMSDVPIEKITTSTEGGATLGAAEQATVDANRLSANALSQFEENDTGDLLTAANRSFVQSALGEMATPNEMNALIDGDGNVSQAGLQRIKNALFAKAYGDNYLLARLSESLDNNVKNITNALLSVAPRMAQMKDSIARGDLYQLDITPSIADAVKKLSALRDEGKPVSVYLQEQSMFGDELSGEAKTLLEFFDANKQRPRKIMELLNKYVDMVYKAGDPKQSTLFAVKQPTIGEMLEYSRESVSNAEGQSLFEQNGVELGTTGIPKSPAQHDESIKEAGRENGTPEVGGSESSEARVQGNQEQVSSPNIKTLYRGEQGNFEDGRHLSKMQSIYDVLGKKDLNASDDSLANVTYYTESPEVAKKYANVDQTIYEETKKAMGNGRFDGNNNWVPYTDKDYMDNFKTLYGHEPRTTGTVATHNVNVGKVLDLTDLGEHSTYKQMEDKILQVAGIKSTTTKDASHPDWKLVDDRLHLSDMFNDPDSKTDKIPVFALLKNNPKEDINRADEFIKFVKENGYNSIKYAEDGTNHYAVINEKSSLSSNKQLPAEKNVTEEPKQLEQLAEESQEVVAPNTKKSNVQVIENVEKSGIELKFDGKPSDEVRAKLKANGFRWNRGKKVWYAKKSDQAVKFANDIAGTQAAETPVSIETKTPSMLEMLKAIENGNFTPREFANQFGEDTFINIRNSDYIKAPGGKLVLTDVGRRFVDAVGHYTNIVKAHDATIQAKNAYVVGAMDAEKPINKISEEEYNLKTEPPKTTPKEVALTKYQQSVAITADWVKTQLTDGNPFNSAKLFSIADTAFGGTQGNSVYTPKDAYDAMELGINKYLLEQSYANTEKATTAEKAAEVVEKIKQDILSKVPTQTKRTAEMDEYQQFSTPPTLAYTAAWVSDVSSKDTVLEPSADIGGIATFAKLAGAKVDVNEYSDRRASIIKQMGFEHVFTENAEQLNNILPESVKPTLILMNPPFSSTAGRMQGKRETKNATLHIEQVLKRLEPGGRLVAIVGQGMADNAPAFKQWWSKIKKEYNVRANVGIDGSNYTKYGTSFGNNLFVIDKNGPTENTLTGKFTDLKDVLSALEVVRNDRQETNGANTIPQPNTVEQNSQGTSSEGRSEVRSSGRKGNIERVPTDGLGVGERQSSSEKTGGHERSNGNDRKDNVSNGPAESDGLSDEERGRRQLGNNDPKLHEAQQSSGRSGVSDRDVNTDTGLSASLKVEQVNRQNKNNNNQELSDSTFNDYQPQRLKIPGAKAHPSPLVQSAAMAAVEPPNPTYSPKLSKEVINKGKLSIAQLEPVVYAGQSFEQTLPNKTRKGYFIGDGTGVGKGREISGIIMDSLNHGKKKAVWVSKNDPLFDDAVRDWTDIGGKEEQLFSLSKTKLGDSVKQKAGVLFATYPTLAHNLEVTGNGEIKTKVNKSSRLDQIISWLGKDFDGVIAFDEAHMMANSVPTKGKRGVKKASARGLAGVELQKLLPNARIVYVSATGATEVENLAYASRLGLWGDGTSFGDVNDFIDQIKSSGLAAMELVARDMKALGVYLARNLSYDGVTYGTLTHNLTPEQREIYNTMAKGWQVVLQNIHEALKATGAVGDDGNVKNSNAKKNAMGQFWGSQQRFFNQILTSMQMPAVVEDVKKQIKAGNAIVMQLVNTNEATQNRALSQMAEDASLEDLDMTPRDILMQFIDKSFPVQQYEEYTDEEGNVRSRPVVDSQGNPLLNREAVDMKEDLMNRLGSMKVPEGPLEIIINTFGTKAVGEVTGRQRRVVREKDSSGRITSKIEKRSKAHNKADVKAFLDDKKSILIFSEAGGTGQSFHAGANMKNQRRRIHYLIQPGWRADSAVQGFGRTHRSGEVSQPHYVLVTTNLKGQKRFISTIARRLDQLGALTKGQRDAANQGLFSAKDNLESEYAKDSLQRFYENLMHNAYADLNTHQLLVKMGLESLENNDDSSKKRNVNTDTLRDVPKFLNRLLTLEATEQNRVFDYFSDILDQIIDAHIANGTLDTGMETLRAEGVNVKDEKTVYSDPNSNAETKYVELEAKYKNDLLPYDKALRMRNFAGFYKNDRSGKVWAVRQGASRTAVNGAVTNTYVLHSPSIERYRTIDENEFSHEGWKKLNESQGKELWQQALEKEPDFRSETLHMITGAILPIWDRLPQGQARVIRVQTDDGRVFLGRIIKDRDINSTLKRLGTSKEYNFSTDDIKNKIIGENNEVELSNGWRLARRRVSGENRVEILGDNLWKYDNQFKNHGIISERIQYNTRYFLPTGEDFNSSFEWLTKDKQVTDVVAPEKASGSLNFGFDPTFGKFDNVNLVEKIKKAAGNIKNAMPGLIELGKRIFSEGYTKSGDWAKKMRAYLGDEWNMVKNKIVDVWKQVKETLSDERGSIRLGREQSFAKQLDDWANGKLRSDVALNVCNTPEVLIQLGVKRLPIEISQRVVAKIVNPEGINGGKHDLGLELLKQLPEQLGNPVMVFKSSTVKNSIVILTELNDSHGRSVIAAIHMDVGHGRHMVNAIASMYGRNNEINFVRDQLKNDRVLYADENKSRDWFQSRGLQLPKEGFHNHDSNDIILHQEQKNVNDASSEVAAGLTPELAAKKKSESGSDKLYSGFDPTGGKFDDKNVADIIKSYFNKKSVDSSNIKEVNEQAVLTLAQRAGIKPAENVEIREKPLENKLGVISNVLSSVNEVARKHPQVKPIFRLASIAMEKQETLRNEFRHRKDKWENVLGKDKSEKASLYKLLLQGDIDEKDYTNAELRDEGYSDKVIKAYRMVKVAMDKAYNIANEVRQGIETKSENLDPYKLAKLKKNKFVTILKEIPTIKDNILVTYKTPKIREETSIMTKQDLAEMKQNPNVDILSEKPYGVAEHALPGSSGLTHGADFYEVHYMSQTPPINKRGGYIPHFFHDWFIMERTTDKETGETTYSMLDSGNTMREATQKANKIAEANPDMDIVIQPKQFKFSGEQMQAAVVGDFEYLKMQKKVSEDLQISLADAKQFMDGKVSMKGRHRFMGNFLQRKGAEGYEKNLDWVLSHHFNMISRYVAMDPFKSKSISTFERLFGRWDSAKSENKLSR